jgi:hypothetical protein
MVSQSIFTQEKISNSGVQVLGDVLDKFNQNEIAKEIQRLDTLPEVFPYPEYSVGHRTSYPIWNQSGDIGNANIYNYEGNSSITSIGIALPHICEVLTDTFHLEYLKIGRINKYSSGAFALPHRDYSDNQKKADSFYTRIHIPIQTQLGCWHAYDAELYHMQFGEIWLHDGSIVHSACNFSSEARLHILLDFDPEVVVEDLFKDKSVLSLAEPRDRSNREIFGNKDLEQLLKLADVIDPYNFKDITAVLCKVPFTKKVACSAPYDWLIQIARASGNAELIQKSEMAKPFFIQRKNPATVSEAETVPQFRFF